MTGRTTAAPKTPSPFPNRLRAAMKENGLSQRSLARSAGTSKQTVTNWLNGKHEPNLSQLRKLAPVLGVSVGFLAGEDDIVVQEPSAFSDLLTQIGDLNIGPVVGSFGNTAPTLFNLLTQAEELAKRPRGSDRRE